ncbi:MAG: glycosyltransferase family 4 protein [Bacteroidia bacterium]
MLKIIFCTDGIFPHEVGGMQRHSRLLMEELAKNENIKLVVIHPHQVSVFDPQLNIKEEFISPIDKDKNYLLECYHYSKRVYAVLANYPDYIIYSQGLSVWYNIKKINQKIIVNPHGLEAYQSISLKDKLTGIPFRIIFNYLFKHSTKVVSLGGKLTEILAKRIQNSKQKIVVLPNAVILPPHFERTENSSKLNVLFVARFAHNKGIHVLLQAIKELNAEGYSDKINFHLGGKGPLFETYRTHFQLKNVEYLGFISDEQLITLYKGNDLFVLPTLFEGMPTVVLEAMSYGMPIIVSNVGATAELVDENNGYLIEKNNVSALKKSILDFYNLSAEEKNKLSNNSFTKIKNNFTWKLISEKHIEVFNILKSDNEKN